MKSRNRCPAEVFIRDDLHISVDCLLKVGHLGEHENNKLRVSWTDAYLIWDDDANDYRSIAGLDEQVTT